MYEVIRSVLAFILVLGVLVFVHELGHYLAARWRGVHVDVFSIGFGRPLLRWSDSVGTEWRLCPIPLGGYVRLHGFEDPEDATEEQKAAWIPGKIFHEKSVGSRIIVVLAGPVFNFLLAIVFFAALYACVGKATISSVVSGVQPGSPAAVAGIRPGDAIRKVGDHTVISFYDMQNFVAEHPGEEKVLSVLRGGELLHIPVKIASVTTRSKAGQKLQGRLGVEFARSVSRPLPVGRAVLEAGRQTWTISVATLSGLWQMVTGQHSAKDLGGPLRIAQLSGQVSHYGVASLVSFMALLSINLGLINLFPIPILDGGRLVFYGIEALMGRPVPRRIQEWSFQAGFFLIAGLFLFSTFNDLSQIGLFRWFTTRGGG